MALFMADVAPFRIMILGRWSSDAFLHYLRPNVVQWTSGMSELMSEAVKWKTTIDEEGGRTKSINESSSPCRHATMTEGSVTGLTETTTNSQPHPTNRDDAAFRESQHHSSSIHPRPADHNLTIDKATSNVTDSTTTTTTTQTTSLADASTGNTFHLTGRRARDDRRTPLVELQRTAIDRVGERSFTIVGSRSDASSTIATTTHGRDDAHLPLPPHPRRPTAIETESLSNLRRNSFDPLRRNDQRAATSDRASHHGPIVRRHSSSRFHLF
jgi:hypothetical protein